MKIYYDNNRRFYYWGLLGLIPGIGAIAGIVLIYKALIRKDRILAIIGFAGILVTIAFYYSMVENPAARKRWAAISYTQINNLVSDIEFYKLKKGNVPDNLQTLRLFNKHAFIYDILTVHAFARQLKEYNYKKMGDKYLLFSSGIDEIPNTPDDIYPGQLDFGNFKYSYIKK